MTTACSAMVCQQLSNLYPGNKWKRRCRIVAMDYRAGPSSASETFSPTASRSQSLGSTSPLDLRMGDWSSRHRGRLRAGATTRTCTCGVSEGMKKAVDPEPETL